jgi:hypothetical protein
LRSRSASLFFSIKWGVLHAEASKRNPSGIYAR